MPLIGGGGAGNTAGSGGTAGPGGGGVGNSANGCANTGGGAGGVSTSPASGRNGGSGIVVVKELDKANGVWSIQSQFQAAAEGRWPK